MTVIGVILMIFGVCFFTNGCSLIGADPGFAEAMRRAGDTPERLMTVGGILLIAGFLLINSKSKKETKKKEAEKKKIIANVNWPQVKSNIHNIKTAADAVYKILIKSEGDKTYAELVGSGRLSNKSMEWYSRATSWTLQFNLDVDESFLRKHADDYVSFDYPYENKWIEKLDENSAVDIFMSPDGTSVSCWLRCHIGVPGEVSEQEIKKHVGHLL